MFATTRDFALNTQQLVMNFCLTIARVLHKKII